MSSSVKMNWLGVSTVFCATALLCACSSTISSVSDHGRAMLAAVPGADYKLLMPPVEMQQRIETLIRTGKAPRYVTMPERRIADICGRGEHVVLGCVYETGVGKTIFIAETSRGEARHMLLVHEYAHYLYDWRH
jgi:hypothetical protein